MKLILKQTGKAICYFLLFTGSQVILSFALQIIYGVKVGLETTSTGEALTMETLDMAAFQQGFIQFITENMNWLILASGGLTLLILWLFFKIRKKKLLNEACLFKFDKNKILPVLLGGIAAFFFLSCVLALLPLSEGLVDSYVEASQGLMTGNLALRAVGTVIAAPIVEEIIFRGLILSRLKKAMKTWVAILISSLLFGLVHGQLLWMTYAFVLGMVFAAVAESAQSVTAAILFHMAFNAVSLFAGYIHISGWQIILAGAVSFVVLVGVLFKGRVLQAVFER